MPKYIVTATLTKYFEYEVEAKNIKEARQIVEDDVDIQPTEQYEGEVVINGAYKKSEGAIPLPYSLNW
jgi:hypothetical protein